jgi:hypothetical protein
MSYSLQTVFISFLVDGVENHSFFLVKDWLIEILSFVLGQFVIIFREHHLKVAMKTNRCLVLMEQLNRMGVNRHSPVPIVLHFFVVKSEVSHSARRSFINILQLVFVLDGSFSLVKEFFVVCM